MRVIVAPYVPPAVLTRLPPIYCTDGQDPRQLFTALDALGIAHATVKHPPLFTVEQSRALRGQIPGGHTKNLFLRDKKSALYLVVAEEDAEIELKGLHRLLGATAGFRSASADLLRECWA